MHISRRFLIVVSLGLLIVPLAGSALLLGDVGIARQELVTLLDRARSTFEQTETWQEKRSAALAQVDQLRARVAQLGREKLAIRLRISELRALCDAVRGEANAVVVRAHSVARFSSKQTVDIESSLHAAALAQEEREVANTSPSRILLRHLGSVSLGEETDTFLQRRALLRAQASALLSLNDYGNRSHLAEGALRQTAAEFNSELTALEAQREALLKEYRSEEKKLTALDRTLTVSDARLKEMRIVTAQVHRDILRLLSRMGQDNTAGAPTFAWPVQGGITTQFLDPDYFKLFKIQHVGIDIACLQGTRVLSAAAGTVLLVRDGGTDGYTYVLISHDGGFATLYGHLSSVSVSVGQEVQIGQEVGKSGGEPGTPGAGPTTTGQHLHLEVLKDGENVDPLGYLSH